MSEKKKIEWVKDEVSPIWFHEIKNCFSAYGELVIEKCSTEPLVFSLSHQTPGGESTSFGNFGSFEDAEEEAEKRGLL